MELDSEAGDRGHCRRCLGRSRRFRRRPHMGCTWAHSRSPEASASLRRERVSALEPGRRRECCRPRTSQASRRQVPGTTIPIALDHIDCDKVDPGTDCPQASGSSGADAPRAAPAASRAETLEPRPGGGMTPGLAKINSDTAMGQSGRCARRGGVSGQRPDLGPPSGFRTEAGQPRARVLNDGPAPSPRSHWRTGQPPRSAWRPRRPTGPCKASGAPLAACGSVTSHRRRGRRSGSRTRWSAAPARPLPGRPICGWRRTDAVQGLEHSFATKSWSGLAGHARLLACRSSPL